MKTYFIGGIGIFPIAGIRTKPPMNYSQNISIKEKNNSYVIDK